MMTSGRGPIETKRKSVFLFFWFGADPIDGYWSMVTNSQNVYHSCLVASLFPRARHIFGRHRRLAVHLWCGVISSFRIYSITHVAYFELPGKKSARRQASGQRTSRVQCLQLYRARMRASHIDDDTKIRISSQLNWTAMAVVSSERATTDSIYTVPDESLSARWGNYFLFLLNKINRKQCARTELCTKRIAINENNRFHSIITFIFHFFSAAAATAAAFSACLSLAQLTIIIIVW